jgi:hypothetical protein
VLVFLPLVSEWVLLHTYFDVRQIYGEGIRVERYVGKKTVVFSNGEEWHTGLGHTLFMALLCVLGWLLDVWVTRWVARRYAPSVWAKFPGGRGGAATRSVAPVTRRPPASSRDRTRRERV